MTTAPIDTSTVYHSTMTASDPFHFFAWPAELRVLVYAYLVPTVPSAKTMKDSSGLFLSCQQARSEMMFEVEKKSKVYAARVTATWPFPEAPIRVNIVEPLRLSFFLRIRVPGLRRLAVEWHNPALKDLMGVLLEHPFVHIMAYTGDDKTIFTYTRGDDLHVAGFSAYLEKEAEMRQVKIRGKTHMIIAQSVRKYQPDPNLPAA
jgi:hypothetical protein